MTNKANNESVNTSANETKVVCPVCGSEFAIGEHEHEVKNGIAIGKDSGLGTIVLPVSKRGDALKAAGIDPQKYFSIQLPTGGEQLMKMDDDGKAVPVGSDDPVIAKIIAAGTVPNRNLFRRWVMALVFRGLTAKDWRGRELSFTEWMKRHGYEYTWKMLIDELHTQKKLEGRDAENFRARNRWFNKDVAVAMARDYVSQMRDNALRQKVRNCKGAPYIRVKGFDKGVFVADINKKLVQPLNSCILDIRAAKDAAALERAVRRFWDGASGKEWNYNQCAAWKDAYKGAGAYFTMQNLLRFHGCTFPKDNDFYERGKSGLQMLEAAAESYADGEGWRLFGLMKSMLEENRIDIEAKRKQWAEEKKARLSR